MFPPLQVHQGLFASDKPPPLIHRLPNELLLHIAEHITHLDRNWDLANLALVSKRWRVVAQEWLLKEPRFHIHFMQRYMCEVGKRKELLAQIKTVEIWSNSKELEERRKNHYEEKSRAIPITRAKAYLSLSAPKCMTSDAGFLKTCTDIIERKSSHAEHQAEWLSALEEDVVPALFSVLLCMLPNLRELKLSDAWMLDFPFLTTAFSSSAVRNIILPFEWAGNRRYQRDALAALVPKLTVLEIPTDMTAMSFSQAISTPFNLHSFTNLRNLAITMRAISHRADAVIRVLPPPDPREILPKTLQRLRITEATHATANFLNQTCLVKKTGHFPHLERMEIYHLDNFDNTWEDAVVARSLHPVKDVRSMCADAQIAVFLYFPPWGMRSWESGGGAPWRLKDESERLRRAEEKCWEIDAGKLRTLKEERFEVEWDADGDFVMA